MSLPRIFAERRDRLAFWALAGLALLVAHDAIYLVQIGPGQEVTATLRTAGHEYWGLASLALIAIALVIGVSTWLRMRRLRRRAASLAAACPSGGPVARRFAAAWLRLSIVVAVGFAIQENGEHVIAHGHTLGIGALLGPEHPLALPVIGVISAVAAVVGALITRTQDTLVLGIEAALRRFRHEPVVGSRPAAPITLGTGSVIAHPGAGRAPPTVVVFGT